MNGGSVVEIIKAQTRQADVACGNCGNYNTDVSGRYCSRGWSVEQQSHAK